MQKVIGMGLFDKILGLPSLNEIKGNVGEQLAKYYSKVMTDALVLHDILIDGADGKYSQIGLLMIGSKGIYVVEVKMYPEARIYGDGKNSKWYYYLGTKRFEIYSPLKQNQKHIQYLKKFLADFGDVPCFSVLTIICEDFKVSNINENSEYISTAICSGLPAMSRGIEAIAKDKPIVFSDKQKKEIYQYIMDHQYSGKEKRIEHLESIKELKKSQEEMKNQKICPYCKTPLVLRKGKYGDFYGCCNFPKCRYTLKV